VNGGDVHVVVENGDIKLEISAATSSGKQAAGDEELDEENLGV